MTKDREIFFFCMRIENKTINIFQFVDSRHTQDTEQKLTLLKKLRIC